MVDRRRSLAWRLATTYLLTTLAILFGLSAAAYFSTAYYLDERLEEELAGQADFYAAYAASLIQNRPFVDGNKRIGFMAAYMFLDLNGATLVADEVSATAMTLSLAASEIEEKAYASWLSANIRIA